MSPTERREQDRKFQKDIVDTQRQILRTVRGYSLTMFYIAVLLTVWLLLALAGVL